MIKVILITFIGAGVVGTSAQTLGPESVEITTNQVKVTAAATGVTTTPTQGTGLSLTLKTKSGNAIRFRL